MKNMGYGIRDSVKAAAAVLCLVNAALLAILLMSAFDLGGVNESAVRTRTFRGRKLLIDTLKKEGYLDERATV